MDVGFKEQPKRAKFESEKADSNGEKKHDVVVVRSSADIPEEILEKTFLKLEDFQDLKAVSDACPQFSRILAPSKPMWAFQKIFPLIFSQLDRDDILNCRRVCNSWTWAVDSFLQTRPYNRDRESYPAIPRSSGNSSKAVPAYAPVFQTNLTTKDLTPMHLYPKTKVTRYLEEMSSHPSNPLILRSVELTNCWEGDYDSQKMYWEEVFRFLSKFGDNIFYAAIGPEVDYDRSHPTFNYRMLRKALTLMPNLKNLYVMGFETGPYVFHPDFDLKCRLDRYIQRNPLPALRHMESVENLLDKPVKNGLVMDEIMKRYPNLNRISTDVSFLSLSEMGYRPQLNRLSLIIDAGVQSWLSFCFKLRAPNLQRLDLIVQITIEIAELLEPLQNSSFQALEYVSLEFLCRPEHFMERYSPDFILEKVKTLEISDSPNVQYKQILSHMPGLEYILVCYEERSRSLEQEEEDGQEGMQIRNFILSETIYESDIWLNMKHLKNFTIARNGETGDTETEIIPKKTYTRDQYNRKKKSGK